MPTMMPLMDKDTVRYITQNITPEEVEYVAGIKSTIEDTCATNENCDDIIFLTKLLAFYTKFKVISTSIVDNTYSALFNDFLWRLEQYKEDVFENIQSIIGPVKGSNITKLELPVSDNPLELINEIKQCVQNWFMLHTDNIEYEGTRALTSNFLATVHKFIYIFRLCKIQSQPQQYIS